MAEFNVYMVPTPHPPPDPLPLPFSVKEAMKHCFRVKGNELSKGKEKKIYRIFPQL